MKTTGRRSQFVVRELRARDELGDCLKLDHSYETDRVWQVDMREEAGSVTVRFRSVRLPREMYVEYPRALQLLEQSWQERDCFLVAASENVLLGYINLRIRSNGEGGWIHDLVVDRPFRRRRIASALLEQASHWASLQGIPRVTLELQTKNYPGIQFALAHGFSFCGYNDHYYLNRDIAVFFSKNLR